MLLPIEKLLDETAVAEFQDTLLAADWEEGGVSAGGIAKTVKNNWQLVEGEISARLQANLLGRLNQHPLFVSAALPAKIFPPKFNRYGIGQQYGFHVDSAILSLAPGQLLRGDVSVTVFLSDPEDYKGGELCIETQYGLQEVKLNAGDVILYPSTSLHEVKPVTAGERLASFMWVQSMVRQSFQREQLFELDQVIQQLTIERGVGDEEVRRLGALYHNLLREWAEV